MSTWLSRQGHISSKWPHVGLPLGIQRHGSSDRSIRGCSSSWSRADKETWDDNAMLWSKLRRQETGIQVVEARSKWKRANASSKDIWKLHRANLYCSGSTSTAGCSLVDCIRRKTLSRIVSKLQAGRLGLAQVSLHPHRHQEHHHPLHQHQMLSCLTSRPT